MCGTLLIKPDMGHMETWPDLYKEDVTYIKCSWDYSDLGEKIDLLLSNDSKRRAIASGAQDVYKRYLSENGREEFVDRVCDVITKHVNKEKGMPAR